MDYNLRETPILTTKEVLSVAEQQSVDLDFTLPDYCADIEKILKCSMKVKVFSHSLSGGVITVTGETVINILYTDSNKKALRCFEQSESFTASISSGGEIGEHIISVTPKPEYINCRALTPRRLTVHGAFSLNVKLTERKLVHLYSSEEKCDLQTKEKNFTVCQAKIFTEDRLSISEAVTFGTRKTVETIVNSGLSANLTDFTLSKERLNLKGDLVLRLLYVTDASTGEVDHYVCNIPFSEVVKITDEICDIMSVNVSVSSFDVTLKRESVTEEPVVHLEASLKVEAIGYKEEDATYICDAYSTDYDTKLQFEDLCAITKVKPSAIAFSHKASLTLGDKPVTKILDILYDAPYVKGEIKDSELFVSTKADLTILAVTDEDELVCIDRQIPIEHTLTLEEGYNFVNSIKGDISSLSYRIGDNNDMELRIEMNLKALVSEKCCLKEVSQISKLSDVKKTNPHSPLTLYYAQAGENLWEISKKYSTPAESLLIENSLTEDELHSPQMIMIITT